MKKMKLFGDRRFGRLTCRSSRTTSVLDPLPTFSLYLVFSGHCARWAIGLLYATDGIELAPTIRSGTARTWNGKVIQTCCSEARARLIGEKKTR
jgi:hypothetical protein